MGRPSKIWLRKSDGYYCVTHGGKKIRLSRDRAEAERAFHQLMLEPKQDYVRKRPPFRELADAFLERSKEENTPDTFATHLTYLQSFCDHVKGRRAPDLTGDHVAAWIKANPAWGQSTRSLAVQKIKACLNWGVAEGWIAENPLKAVKHGQMKRRERLLDDEERRCLFAHVEGTDFGDFLFALDQTGMRPYSEAAKITAAMIDWREGSITFQQHKTARKGKRRVVFLPPALIERFRRLAERRPEGVLLCNSDGNPWCRQTAFKRMQVVQRDLGMKGITLYSFRHTWITNAIMRGIPLPVVAALVGNSVKVILRNYEHVGQRTDALKEAARKAVS